MEAKPALISAEKTMNLCQAGLSAHSASASLPVGGSHPVSAIAFLFFVSLGSPLSLFAFGSPSASPLPVKTVSAVGGA